MQTDLREVAYYMPEGSQFAALVKEIYNIQSLTPFKNLSSKHTNESALFGSKGNEIPSGNLFISNMKMLPNISDAANIQVVPKQEHKLQDKNPIEENLQNHDVKQVLEDFAKKLSNTKGNVNIQINNINKIIISVTKEAKEKGLGKRLIKFISTIIAGIAILVIAPTISNSDQNKMYSIHTNSGNLKIRSSPEMLKDDSNLLKLQSSGTLVSVIGEKDGYYEIKCEDVEISDKNVKCFASKKYLIKIK